MPAWVFLAALSAVFAGLTSVLAKSGMKDIGADLGLSVRIVVIFGLVAVQFFAGQGVKDLPALTGRSALWLAASGVTTTLSWLLYYRAMKLGPVSYVAIIDKGSILITLLLSVLILKEPVTPRLLGGAGLVIAGLVVLGWK